MNVVHYLDSARLGLMSPSASRRHGELARFATTAAASPLMDTLLQDGGEAWPETVQREFPELSSYPGIPGFRRRLLETLGCEDWQRLVLGTSSNSLIRIASQLLFGPCERVLTTDLAWPVYRKVLERCAADRSRTLHVIPLRQFIARNCPTGPEIADFVFKQFRKHSCDGLFLTAVSHDGIRLPAGEMISAIKRRSEVKVSVIDGAQEFAQVDHHGSLRASDFYMTSGHKWAGSFIPIAIGVFGTNRSASRIDQIATDQIDSGLIDDPLMQLCWDSTDSPSIAAPSTANVAALFACDAAITDLASEPEAERCKSLGDSSVDGLLEQLAEKGWQTTPGSTACRSRTWVLNHASLAGYSPAEIRVRFASQGIALTAYDQGVIRLSIPRVNWNTDVQFDVGSRIGSAQMAFTG
ncbi:Aminotransferase class-V [Stieleria neptunia]|uniref:Aminotransferase class-V n=1 Tax=Stieleria neptunia TaxID=2527979 RepID=A0A518HNQ8_9BACT|nr:aminotransferase class V-fold PLP-dependent enzyme [Stieleria neptunia]QDV42486.1 Aminotransferase class-V [Stieleria neptunia]